MLTAVTALAALLVAPVVPAAAGPEPGSATPQLTARSAGSGTCSIVSNAGNCYAAGEFCRQRDLGKSTTDADSESIICVMESGRPHWHPANDGGG
jgi:hypothetical protein